MKATELHVFPCFPVVLFIKNKKAGINLLVNMPVGGGWPKGKKCENKSVSEGSHGKLTFHPPLGLSRVCSQAGFLTCESVDKILKCDHLEKS